MNLLIIVLTLSAFIFSIFLGKTGELSNAAISGASQAVTLVIKLAGGLVFWSGMMNLIKKSGISDLVARLLSPIIRLIFPKLDKKSRAAQYIGLNLSANMLGLGNAATPFGIEAMRELNKLNPTPDRPSNDMVYFAVINSASIQLLPTTVAIIRAAHGSKNPMDILPAVLMTSIISLAVGLFFAKIIPLFERKRRK
ncbi:MAG: spore maturation protein A [Oscillospiraceae bacterium]|nr:spore maturation protein A [Oscillospiraceae bacterium]